jgi:hypothetical protein
MINNQGKSARTKSIAADQAPLKMLKSNSICASQHVPGTSGSQMCSMGEHEVKMKTAVAHRTRLTVMMTVHSTALCHVAKDRRNKVTANDDLPMAIDPMTKKSAVPSRRCASTVS